MEDKAASQATLPSFRSLVYQTLTLYRKNAGLVFGYSGYLLIPLVISLLAFLSFEKETAELVQFFMNVVVYGFLATWLCIVFITLTPLLVKKSQIHAATVSQHAWSLLVPYVFVSLIVGLMNLVGFLALLIPGLIVSTLCAFSGSFVVLKKLHLFDAIRASVRLVKPRFFAVFFRLYGGILLFLFCFVTLTVAVEGVDALLSHTTLLTAIMSTPSVFDEVLYRLVEIVLFPLILIYQTLLFLALQSPEETPT